MMDHNNSYPFVDCGPVVKERYLELFPLQRYSIEHRDDPLERRIHRLNA